ncbi:MAG: class I SAM-dependent RNA methyltransferase [Myxococcales bacterium]|nr:class I SAM-dependent RNA methyltransferase [Myxococcales bacterium]
MSDASLQRGQEVSAHITGVALDGRGTAEIAGKLLHVPAALPGDTGWVEVVAVDRQGHRAHGELIALSKQGPGRRTPPCPQHDEHSGAGCTGCPWMPWAPDAQRSHLQTLLAGHGLSVTSILHEGDGQQRTDDGACGYRWSAKRVVFEGAEGLRLGSFRARSHDGAPMTGCLVDHPAIRAAADELETVAQALSVPVWRKGRRSDTTGLRYAWFKTDGAQVLVTLITGDMAHAAVQQLADALTLPVGVAWSKQTGQGNSIRGAAPVMMRGKSELSVSLCGVDVQVGPLGFLQPNPAVASRCYEALVRDESGETLTGDVALDLFAGAGVVTKLLGQEFEQVVPCEAWPESAALLGVEPETTAVFAQRWLAEEQPTPALIVANPPRAGLGNEAPSHLLRIAAPRLHIMSCSPRSLKRDLDALAPKYDLVSLQAFATLPQTPHVELVARLRLK